MSIKPYTIRNRSSNFSRMERMLVAKLCRDNPEIDAKEYDKFTLKRKYDAWKNILALYREEIAKKDLSLPERDIKQLQGCWKRIKDQMRRRKDFDIRIHTVVGEASVNYSTSDRNECYNTRSEANESYTVVTNGHTNTANGEPFCVAADMYEHYESEAESSADNSNCQNQITADKLPENIQQDQVSFNPLLRIKEEIITPHDSGSWKDSDSAISVINTSVTSQSSQPVQAPTIPILQRTTYPIINRGDKRRLSKEDDPDPYIQMAMKEHHLKIKILQLKEWKLRKECLQSGIGLPPDYEIP